MKRFYIALAALLLSCGVASAEILNGTVTNIDTGAKKVTLRRGDTQEEITVAVNNSSDLSRIRAGNRVTFDATNTGNTGWTSNSLQTFTTGLGGTNTSSVAVPSGVNTNAPTLTTTGLILADTTGTGTTPTSSALTSGSGLGTSSSK